MGKKLRRLVAASMASVVVVPLISIIAARSAAGLATRTATVSPPVSTGPAPCVIGSVSTDTSASLTLFSVEAGSNENDEEQALSDGTWQVEQRDGHGLGVQFGVGGKVSLGGASGGKTPAGSAGAGGESAGAGGGSTGTGGESEDSSLSASLNLGGMLSYAWGATFSFPQRALADELFEQPEKASQLQRYQTATYAGLTGDISLDASLGSVSSSNEFFQQIGGQQNRDGSTTYYFDASSSGSLGIMMYVGFSFATDTVVSVTVGPGQKAGSMTVQSSNDLTPSAVVSLSSSDESPDGLKPAAWKSWRAASDARTKVDLGVVASTSPVGTWSTTLDLAGTPYGPELVHNFLNSLPPIAQPVPADLLEKAVIGGESSYIKDEVDTVGVNASVLFGEGIEFGASFGHNTQSSTLESATREKAPGAPMTRWKSCENAVAIHLRTAHGPFPGLGATYQNFLAAHQGKNSTSVLARGGFPEDYDPTTSGLPSVNGQQYTFQDVRDQSDFGDTGSNCQDPFPTGEASIFEKVCRVQGMGILLPHPVDLEHAVALAKAQLPKDAKISDKPAWVSSGGALACFDVTSPSLARQFLPGPGAELGFYSGSFSFPTDIVDELISAGVGSGPFVPDDVTGIYLQATQC